MTSQDQSSLSASQRGDAAERWSLLVKRSLDWWRDRQQVFVSLEQTLRNYATIEDFFNDKNRWAYFYFFQRREAFMRQKRFQKWCKSNLDDYLILPAAEGYISRRDCFFISHFWSTRNEPDPDGDCLRLHQECLTKQDWSLIWVDWTCTPQEPRSEGEERYFEQVLYTFEGIIRESGFNWFYAVWEPRLWILYELAQFWLTTEEGIANVQPDNAKYAAHVQLMFRSSVSHVLERYGYRCSSPRDRLILTSRMEVLILLARVADVGTRRRMMAYLSYHPSASSLNLWVADGFVWTLEPFEGRLIYGDDICVFTPLPSFEYKKGFLLKSNIANEMQVTTT